MKNEKFPKIVACTLVERRGKYFLIKEVLEDGCEYWIVPGGKVEFGESLENAAKRETEEESGMEIEILKFLGHHEAVFPDLNYHSVIFFFLGKSESTNFTLENKALDGKFFSKEEIKKLNLVSSAKWLFETLEF